MDTTSNHKIYDAIDIAEYCLYYCSQRKDTPISNLQLQKILYYIQAKFLVEKGVKCFNDEIVAWRYGPVVENVYHGLKFHASKVIDFKEETLIIEHKDKMLIQEVCDVKSVHNAFTLVQMTHDEDLWRKSRINEVIDINDMKEYFVNNKDKLTI